MGFEQFIGIFSILKYKVKKIVISDHIDDDLDINDKGEGK